MKSHDSSAAIGFVIIILLLPSVLILSWVPESFAQENPWTPQKVITGASTSGIPSLAVGPNGRLYAAWVQTDQTMHFAYFDGTSWSVPQPVSTNGGINARGNSLSLAFFKNQLYLVYRGPDTNQHLYLTTYDGTSWTNIQDVYYTLGGIVYPQGNKPSLAALNNNQLYLVYRGPDNNQQINFITYYGNSGWSTPNYIHNSGSSYGASIASFGGNLYGVWKGADTDQKIWFSGFDGSNWANQQIIQNVGTSVGPSLAQFIGGDNKLYAAWKGADNDQGIYYSSTSDGVNWDGQKVILNVGSSLGPSLSAYNGKLYAAWKGADNDQSIYYSSFALPDFNISTSQSSISVEAGKSVQVTVTVTSVNGFNTPIALDTPNLASELRASFSPRTVYPPPTSTIAIAVPNPNTPPGSYQVDVVGTAGGSLSHSATIYVTVTPPARPNADAGSPQTIKSGAVVMLDGSHSSDPDNYPLTFAWTAPAGSGITLDGANSSNPAFVAPVVKSTTTYTFTLVVTDSEGLESAPASVQITVMPRPQIPPPTIIAPSSPVVATATDNHGATVMYVVKAFDRNGNALVPACVPASGSKFLLGDTTVTCNATDQDGNKADPVTFTVEVIKQDAIPIPIITGGKSDAKVGDVVTFSGKSSRDPNGTITSYSWSFGDGGTEEGPDVSHVFSKGGHFVVVLTVRDEKGANAVAQFPIDISSTSNIPPTAAISSSGPYAIKKPITFSGGNSFDRDGSITDYQWTFGDGQNGSGESIKHSYSEAGKYAVTLTVTDDKGAKDTDKQTIEVLSSGTSNNQPPVAQITSIGPYFAGSEVRFSGKESYDLDGHVNSYSWNFGDGGTATGMNVTHIYDKEGVYTVKLTVIDDDGLPNTVQSNPIEAKQKPVATFAGINLDLATLGSIGGAVGGGVIGFVKWMMGRNKGV